MTIALFMTGFDQYVRARDLAIPLEKTCGPIHRLDIPYSQSKPFAFVHFKNDEHAVVATKMQNFYVGEHLITIKYAKYESDTYKDKRSRIQYTEDTEDTEDYSRIRRQCVAPVDDYLPDHGTSMSESDIKSRSDRGSIKSRSRSPGSPGSDHESVGSRSRSVHSRVSRARSVASDTGSIVSRSRSVVSDYRNGSPVKSDEDEVDYS
ncbi:hypothetical protein HDU81_011392 [Chytriomyces hyalinus]|nr:hypothetical protein HDU81_011392 [Chytriomyces hyalinus]